MKASSANAAALARRALAILREFSLVFIFLAGALEHRAANAIEVEPTPYFGTEPRYAPGASAWTSALQSQASLPDRVASILDGEWNRILYEGQGYHGAVYDSARDRLIVLGGRRGGVASSTVRALDLGGGLGWLELGVTGTVPPAVLYASYILDPVRNRVIRYGGLNGASMSSAEIWALNLDEPRSWTQIIPAGSGPRSRDQHAAIYDPVGDRMIIYGGSWDNGVSNRLGDVWSLSLAPGGTWTNLVPDGTAGAGRRAGAAPAFDPVGRRMIVHGGSSSSTTFLSDTWSLGLDGALPLTWVALPSAPSGPRTSHAATFDPSANRMIVFGGRNATIDGIGSTWALSLGASPVWTQLVPDNASRGATYLAFAYDTRRGRFLIHGGVNSSAMFEDVQELRLDGSPGWAPMTTDVPQPRWRNESTLAFDQRRNEAVAFGGHMGVDVVGNSVWALDLAAPERWSNRTPAAGGPQQPLPRRRHVAIIDPLRDRMIIYGGQSTANGVMQDIWETPLGGPTALWSQISATPTGPGQRQYAASLYDPIGDRMIVYGGLNGSSSLLSDAWALTLTGTPIWVSVSATGSAPAARYGHAMVYDSRRKRAIVFGGLDPNRSKQVFALTLEGAPTWQNLTPLIDGPVARAYATAVYDSIGDRLIVHGGDGLSGALSDSWALSLSGTPAWTQLVPSGAGPLSRTTGRGIYDPRENRMIVYGGSTGSFLLGDAWSLQWQRPLVGGDLTTISTPSARYLINLGRPDGATRPSSIAGPAGVHEFSSAPGNGDGWFALNDGVPSSINTFGGTSPDYFGWNFKSPATVRGLRFDNRVAGSAGMFQSAPNVQVFDGSTWQNLGVSWSPAYDPSPGTEVRSYTVTFASPAVGVRGVRLIGDASGTVDGDGYIGISELVAVGEPGFPQTIDFSVDLAEQVGVEPFLTRGFTADAPDSMLDNDLGTAATSTGPGTERIAGVHWSSPQDSVTALGVVFRFLPASLGGWFDESVRPLVVEWTADGGATWQEVQNLSKSSYSADVSALAALVVSQSSPLHAGYLFTFDPIDGIDGLRIRGDGAGGVISIAELEVFAGSAKALPAPGPRLAVAVRSGMTQSGYVAGTSPTIGWIASAAGVDSSRVSYRTWFDLTSPYLVGTDEITESWPDPVTILPGFSPAASAALFQRQRVDSRGVGGNTLHYSVPVANGTYDVRLYFAEMSSQTQPGQRVMLVSIENQPLDSNFDMLSGGRPARQAIALETRKTIQDGVIDVDLSSVSGNATIAGIEIAAVNPAPRVIHRINAGGPFLAAADGSYPGWSADQDAPPTSDFSPSKEGTYSGLAEGVHHLRIDARAPGAQRDSLVQLFSVDVSPPSVAFAAPTPPESAWVARDSTAIGVTGTDSASPPSQMITRIEVDDVLQPVSPAAPGQDPPSVFPITGLSEGTRRVDVRRIDAAGNQSPEITRILRVDLTAPETFVSSPDPGDTLTTPTVQLAVSGTDTQSSSLKFAYAVDGGAYSAPANGPTLSVPGLTDGAHTIRVHAVDLAGNVDASPVELAIVVDATAPSLAFTVAPSPASCIATRTPTLEWTSADVVTAKPDLRFETRVDAGAFVPVGPDTTATFGPLAGGQHTVTVRVTDLAGNTRTISRTFKVDPSAPLVFAPTARLLDAALLRFQCTGTDSVGVTGFQLQVSTAPNFGALVVDQVLAAAGQLDFQSTPGLTYYYRASAVDCAGNVSAYSDPVGALSVPALPDLVVDSVAASTNAVIAGQSVGVRWAVRNQAFGGTSNPNWKDRLYLSADLALDLDGTDVLLAEFVNLTHLAPAELYARDEVVTLPRGIAGAYHVLVTTDFYDELPESLGTNNVLGSASMTVSAADAANLETLSLRTLPFEEWIAGGNMRVEWTVKNTGPVPADTDRWYDTVFLSEDATFSVSAVGTDRYLFGDRPIGSVQFVGLLDSSGTYTRDEQVRLPLDVQDRDYWLFVVADQNVTSQNQVVAQRGEVFENGADLNVSPAFRIQARKRLPANLVFDPAHPASAPDSALSGQSIAVTWTVRNDGDTTVVNVWEDRVYLSMDDLLDAGDILLGGQTRNAPMAQLTSYAVTLPVTLPSFIGGTYRILVQTDATGLLVESNEMDNVTLMADPLYIRLAPSPDLIVQNASGPAQGMAGTSVGVRWRVDNVGAATAGAPWSDRLYLTLGSVWNPNGAIALGASGGPSSLVAGGYYERQVAADLPFSLLPGTYYLWVVADGFTQVTEYLGEDNNARAAGTIAVTAYPLVDLDVTPLVGPITASSGTTIPVEWSVTNLGQATTIASSWRDRIYLSADGFIDSGDISLSTTVRGGALAAGASYVQSTSITLPNGSSGTYRLLVRTDVDDVTGDGNPTNDEEAFPDPLVVSLTPPPNLVVASIVPGAAPVAGQPFQVQWTERNDGAGETLPGTWSTYVYASLDPIYGNGDDVFVAARSNSVPLAGDEPRVVSAAFDMPHQFAGPYYLLVRIDASNGVFESNESDNVTVSPPINVSLAPPADLVVTSVSPPAEVIPGRPATVSWTIANRGPNRATGVIRDVVYLSEDAVFDPEIDRVLGLVTRNIDLAPEQSATASAVVKVEEMFTLSVDGELIAAVPALSPGPHYAFVRTNALRNIRETNYENDVANPGAPFAVKIPVLPIGGEETATLARGEAAYWRIDTPPGKDLLVTVESSQAGATNELFASLGQAPDPRTFDFSGPSEFTPSPFLSIPSTADGSYFVRVSNNALPSGVLTTTLTVRARLQPYSITSLTPNRAGGPATCAVRGAGLTAETRFFVDLGGEIGRREAAVVAYENSGRAFVRFDASGLPIGNYPFVAVTGESTATAAGGFTIEAGSPLDVATSIETTDLIRQNSTASQTIRFTNVSNRDVPFLRARILLAPEIEVINLATSGGLLRRSDLWPSVYAPIAGDVMTLENGAGDDSLRVIDLIARDVSPGQDVTLYLSLRGFARDTHSLRALVRLDETTAFLESAVDEIEATRQAVLAAGVPLDPAIEALVGNPFAMRDSALSQTYVASGLISHKTMAQFLGGLPPGSLGTSAAGPPAAPPELDPGTGPCELPGTDPGCTVRETVRSELPPCRSCYETTFPVTLLLPQRLDVMLPGSSCEGFNATQVRDIEVVSPCDPNLIVSTSTPTTFGTLLGERWVKKDAEVQYTVYFENLKDAGGTAKSVRISVPVPSTMDGTTFRLKSFWIGAGTAGEGGITSEPLDNYSFVKRFAYEGVPVDLQSSGGVDSLLFALATTATTGFLPVNIDERGQGGFVFTLRPKDSALSGARIMAQANIRFDGKPVLTNVDSLRVDALPPTSQVTSVQLVDATNARVRWSGQDDPQGTGVRTYDLYVRQGTEPYRLALAEVSGTEAILPLAGGSEYGFYSQARDNTLNLQPPPAGDQAVIALPGTVDAPESDVPRVFALYQNVPNPFRGQSVIRFDLPREADATLEIYNVAGRRLTTLLGGKRFPAGRHQATVDGRDFPAGVYFYRLRAGDQVSSRKLIFLGR